MSLFERFLVHLKAGAERRTQRLVMEEKIKKFLDESSNNCQKLTRIDDKLDVLQGTIDNVSNKVDGLENEINRINGRLEVIGTGTKMELFDTLYHWKQILGTRGWKTAAEMREVEEIYKVYHDGLGGNGQGQAYYEQIKALPEKELDA